MLLEKAIEYATGVENGTLISNNYVKKQCINFLDDLEKCNNNDSKYIYDIKTIDFIETMLSLMTFANGIGVSGKPIIEGISGFQALILCAFFGFKHRDNIEKRRYETLVLLIARKNAKSWLSSIIIMLLMLLEEEYSDFFSVSVDSNLSGLVKKELKQLIEKSKFKHHFEEKYGKIICKANSNTYTNLCGDSDRLDGRRVSGAILDECGLYKDSGLIDAMETGSLSVLNRTFIFISTAYATDSEIFPNKIKYLENVLDGEIKDESIFGLLYRCEKPSEWDTDKAIFEANPICFTSPSHLEYLQKQREKVKNIPDQLEAYKTKHLNIFLPKDNSESYLSDEDIKPCIIDDYDFNGKEVYLGLDLAASSDNTALSITTFDEELNKFVCKSIAFIPSDSCYQKEKLEKIPYYRYSKKGYCHLTGTRVIDFNYVEDIIDKINEKCIIKVIAYDRAYSQNIVQNLNDKGYILQDIPQGFKGMNNATRIFREWIYTQNVCIVKNPLFTMNMKNAKTVSNTTEQIMLSKKHSNGKIDMIIATLNTLAYIYEVENIMLNPSIKDIWEENR